MTRLYEIVAGYHTTHLLEIGRALGVWQHLASHPGAVAPAVADGLGLDPFYTDVLCTTAFSAGVLERDGDGWRMAPHMDTLLGTPGATFDLSRTARVHVLLGEEYRHYADAFRTGSSISYQDHDEAFMEEIALALQSVPKIFTGAVLPQLDGLEAKFAQASRFLDVGCGGGWAVVELAERYPDAEVVGVEVEPTSAEMAERLVAERDLSDRCRIVQGDASQFASATPFDVVTLFLVYHEIDPGLKRAALAAIRKALAPDGVVVLFDEVMPDSDEALRSMPTRFSALAQWFELTWGNVIGTRGQVAEDCQAAGLEITHEMPFSRFHVFVARVAG